jgi:predicted permease
VQEVVLLGGTTVAVFCILYYAGRFFLGLDGVLASGTRFARGLVLSCMFGTASVFTLIVLPPALGEYVLTGSAVAIQLAINLIGDVVITTYESVATLAWGGFREAVTH